MLNTAARNTKKYLMRDEVIFKPFGQSVSGMDLSCEQNHIIIGAFESNSMFTNLLIGCGAIAAEDAETFRVQYVCVDKVLQRKGVGSALMQCMENRLRPRRKKTGAGRRCFGR